MTEITDVFGILALAGGFTLVMVAFKLRKVDEWSAAAGLARMTLDNCARECHHYAVQI